MTVCASPDYTLTTRFFEGIDGVLEANVWSSGKSLLARLVVTEDSMVSGQDLKQACAMELGEDLTPSLLLLERVRPAPMRMAA